LLSCCDELSTQNWSGQGQNDTKGLQGFGKYAIT
jgi:hypothetical protein